MEFWVLWFIGMAIAIVTRKCILESCEISNSYNNNKAVKIIINLLITICFVIAGGIIVGKWVGAFAFCNWDSATLLDIILMIAVMTVTTIIGSVITYLTGCLILGLDYVKEPISEGFFVVAFIVSIIGWSILIWQYNRNIETTTQIVVESQEERKLLYFCNIPVQNVSGEISGSVILGNGSVSGEITTSDNLPYWYLNQNGEGVFDSVPATASKIVFVDDDQSPHVEIIVYSSQRVDKNHNNGTEKVQCIENRWVEYYFYLPKAIMQYNLN